MPRPPARSLAILPAEPLPPDPQALADQAVAHNPNLVMSEKMTAESEALEKLARRSSYPDFTVMLGYGQRDPVTTAGVKQETPALVSGTVAFNLPIYSYRKHSRAVAEGQARVDSAGADMMKRVAAPRVGGLATSFLMELLVYPAVYLLWKKRDLPSGAGTARSGAGR